MFFETFQKSDVSSESLLDKYNPKEVESGWYEWWEAQNYFKPSKSETESFIMLLPPPNITGTLHLGHTLTVTIQDVILRWKRMKGESAIWIPGIDHAGIATQVAVEKFLKESLGLSKQNLGKEEFLKKIWEWKQDKETIIYNQLRKMGASLDWSRVKFTMDPVHSELVAKSFIQLFNEGLIYRSKSFVNWSCAIQSSISDIEIDWVNIEKKTSLNIPGYEKHVDFGVMYKIAYKICDEDSEIIVDTTRPETMLGDVAIAVHPNDSRYNKYANKMVWHPFRNEKIPIILDESVSPKLGTGAVKVTPAHSLEDFEIGQKHNLKSIEVINEEGCLNNIGVNEKFFGLKRYIARHVLIDELKNLELFRGAYDHSMKIPVCSRSGDVVEPILKSQWFLKCKPLMAQAVNFVKNGDLKIEPQNYVNVWYEWFNNFKDWNLSRQLWWGHQIPMYECASKEKTIWVAALNLEQAKLKASEKLKTPPDSINIKQDPDVLDTWFSSGLLPLNTRSNFSDRASISLMVTGHDILFFWVARMVMLTTHLTGKLPFNQILLHGLVCDVNGRKMSKSLGNVITPEDIIDGRSLSEMKTDLKHTFKQGLITNKNLEFNLKMQQKMFPKGIPNCGIDALRFSLCSNNVKSTFINFDVDICIASRNFCNKLWQALKYFLKIVDAFKAMNNKNYVHLKNLKEEGKNLNLFDKWILSKLAATVDNSDTSFNSNNFHIATKAIKWFVIEEFCGVYLESTKSFLKDHPSHYENTISVFFQCMETSLRLLSPFMPFVTEHLYHALPQLRGFQKSESITITEYPCSKYWMEFYNSELEQQFVEVLQLIDTLRRVVVTYSLIGKNPQVYLKCSNKELADIIFSDMNPSIAKLGRVRSFIPVNSYDGYNFIKKVVNDKLVAYVEHDHDKETLTKNLSPAIKKEKELKVLLEKLNLKMLEKDWEKKPPLEKLQTKKRMENLENELNKIEEFKRVLENCSRSG